MKLYRIYTENKNREAIEELVSKYYEGFTIFEAVGYWKIVRENSLIIEILTEKETCQYFTIQNLCKAIKITNNQESVLLTEQEVRATFI